MPHLKRSIYLTCRRLQAYDLNHIQFKPWPITTPIPTTHLTHMLTHILTLTIDPTAIVILNDTAMTTINITTTLTPTRTSSSLSFLKLLREV